ncbi:hypothetical protein F383_04815 [Gossypium arboreum]|uniref:Uncharacterized protein n=1 Tax=Gossypium arboreum TaxID=29729 RepID=A0A0B0P074_GOSAR|nr:hypothetical protein F383_04815 [Gossypium arboreum]
MIFRKEINKIDMGFLLKKIWREQKDRVFGRGSVKRKKRCQICATPSPIYSTRKPSLFLMKF